MIRTTILAEKCESLDIELYLKKIKSAQEELTPSEFIKSFLEIEAMKDCNFEEVYCFGLGIFTFVYFTSLCWWVYNSEIMNRDV